MRTVVDQVATRLPRERSGRSARPVLPPAGPVWFSSVMGTGILATLLARDASQVPVLLVPASLLTLVGVLLLIGLTASFGGRAARDPAVLTNTLRDPAVVPTWGTVSMGILSIGSALLTVLPQLGAHAASGVPARWVVVTDAGCWVVGTGLGVVTAFGFATVLLRRNLRDPVPAWGLPLVPPMVSATTGAALIPQVGPHVRMALLVAVVACFFLALFLGTLVFATAYHHHFRRAALPIAASASAWIPLGMVGQSMAAAQVIASRSSPLLTLSAADAARRLADAYGYVMLAVALPVVAHAVTMTVRGFRARMPFSPGWWALTFPIGTLALGTRLLGSSTSHPFVTAVGVAATAALCGTWALCAVASVVTIRRVHARR
ncbi:TDT family transporter [Phycicoccus sp. Root101]|uniref:TDT family transporter n=1 Tax=Phycicoccus sp. Root101 TaxID=1736421 RepID=UPI0009E8197D|nr:TDT family transporter [Phycicoccus sp. Root101]